MNLTSQIRIFWDGLAKRERNLIAIGLLVLLPIGLYLYLWQPANAERARLTIRVEQLRGELARLRADSEEIIRLRAQTQIASTENIEATARQAAARFGLADQQGMFIAQGRDRLQVNLESVAFDVLLRWLGELGAQGINLVSCEIESLPEAGQIRIKAMLTRASS